MLCQKCKQMKASSHIHYVKNGIVRDMYLCNSCANEYKNKFAHDSDIFNMLSSLLNENIGQFKQTVKCECCGTDFDTIRKTGRVGCANCYKTFETELSPTIARIHGKTVHVGKKPCDTDDVAKNSVRDEESLVSENETKIVELKAKMADAVAKEDFELAARLRDEIKALEEK